MSKIGWGGFVGGLLLGTVGFKILGSREAKKVYAHTTAAAIRAKDCAMKRGAIIKENAEDIYAEAKEINEKRAAAEEVVEDASEE